MLVIKIKIKNLLIPLLFLSTPSFSQNTMEIFLQNQKIISVDGKRCKAGYLEKNFYANCNNSQVKDDYLLGRIKVSYNTAREIENLNSNLLSRQISDLEKMIDRSILYETGKMIYRTANSFESDMPWWTGSVNAVSQMYVDPKFYARTFIGNLGREAISHQKKAIPLIKMSEQYGVLTDLQYKQIHEELVMSYPYIEPLTQFAHAVNSTKNPAFAIDQKELEEFKKIKFKDKNSPEVKAISNKIITRIRNTPEFKKYEEEKNKRLKQLDMQALIIKK